MNSYVPTYASTWFRWNLSSAKSVGSKRVPVISRGYQLTPRSRSTLPHPSPGGHVWCSHSISHNFCPNGNGVTGSLSWPGSSNEYKYSTRGQRVVKAGQRATLTFVPDFVSMFSSGFDLPFAAGLQGRVKRRPRASWKKKVNISTVGLQGSCRYSASCQRS